MIAYLDASVVLRLVLGERDALIEWSLVERAVVERSQRAPVAR